MRILITEDGRGLAEALARGLSRQGYAADIAYDGEEATDYWSATLAH